MRREEPYGSKNPELTGLEANPGLGGDRQNPTVLSGYFVYKVSTNSM
jgi:hypothetical protein